MTILRPAWLHGVATNQQTLSSGCNVDDRQFAWDDVTSNGLRRSTTDDEFLAIWRPGRIMAGVRNTPDILAGRFHYVDAFRLTFGAKRDVVSIWRIGGLSVIYV